MTSLVEHCSPRSSFSWLPERGFFFWWKTPLIAVSTLALYPINHVKWLEKRDFSSHCHPTVWVSPFWRKRSSSFLCFFAVHLTIWVWINHHCVLHSVKAVQCDLMLQVTLLPGRWCRPQETTSITLFPILLLKHLPREGISFSSTTPLKGSAPVITYTCMQYPKDSVLHSFPVMLAWSRHISQLLADLKQMTGITVKVQYVNIYCKWKINAANKAQVCLLGGILQM